MKLRVVMVDARCEMMKTYSAPFGSKGDFTVKQDDKGNLFVGFKQGAKQVPLGCHVAGFWRHYFFEDA